MQGCQKVEPPADAACGPLQRHALVWLHPTAWREVLARPDRQAGALSCLAHWAAHDLPLVVTQQPSGTAPAWQLGLSAPLRWSRLRLFVQVPPDAIARAGAFPRADAIAPPGPAAWRSAWLSLCRGLAAAGVDARVYGSHGWQTLSGLPHVEEGSDVDLLLAVDRQAGADAAAALLEGTASGGPRLDGELVFPSGAATAWREWAAWRRTGRGPILVKRLRGVALETAPEHIA